MTQPKSKAVVAIIQHDEEKGELKKKQPSCYHCGEPHRLRDCPHIDSNKKGEEIMEAKTAEWREKNAERKKNKNGEYNE